MSDNSYPMVLYRLAPVALTNVDKTRVPLAGNAYGAINVQYVGSDGKVVVPILMDGSTFAPTTRGLPTASTLYLFDGTNNYNRAPQGLVPGQTFTFDASSFSMPTIAQEYAVSAVDGKAYPLSAHNINKLTINPDTNKALNTNALGYSYDYTGNHWIATSLGNAFLDGLDPANTIPLEVMNYNYGYNGATYDRTRVANVYNSIDTAASGNTAVWTPAAGKKFRLMGGLISVSGSAAALTANAIQLRDGAANVILRARAALAATVTGDTQIPFDMGQGYLSSAADNVLNVNVATALTAGGVSVNVWGVEE